MFPVDTETPPERRRKAMQPHAGYIQRKAIWIHAMWRLDMNYAWDKIKLFSGQDEAGWYSLHTT